MLEPPKAAKTAYITCQEAKIRAQREAQKRDQSIDEVGQGYSAWADTLTVWLTVKIIPGCAQQPRSNQVKVSPKERDMQARVPSEQATLWYAAQVRLKQMAKTKKQHYKRQLAEWLH